MLCAGHALIAQSSVDILLIEQGGQDSSNVPRSLSVCPIQCRYYPSTAEISLKFYVNMGHVDVTVTNMASLTEVTYQVSDMDGMMYFPVDYGPVELKVVEESGRIYIGNFYAFYVFSLFL